MHSPRLPRSASHPLGGVLRHELLRPCPLRVPSSHPDTPVRNVSSRAAGSVRFRRGRGAGLRRRCGRDRRSRFRLRRGRRGVDQQGARRRNDAVLDDPAGLVTRTRAYHPTGVDVSVSGSSRAGTTSGTIVKASHQHRPPPEPASAEKNGVIHARAIAVSNSLCHGENNELALCQRARSPSWNLRSCCNAASRCPSLTAMPNQSGCAAITLPWALCPSYAGVLGDVFNGHRRKRRLHPCRAGHVAPTSRNDLAVGIPS